MTVSTLPLFHPQHPNFSPMFDAGLVNPFSSGAQPKRGLFLQETLKNVPEDERAHICGEILKSGNASELTDKELEQNLQRTLYSLRCNGRGDEGIVFARLHVYLEEIACRLHEGTTSHLFFRAVAVTLKDSEAFSYYERKATYVEERLRIGLMYALQDLTPEMGA